MLIGKKIGMTRLFDDDGLNYPVTVIQAGPCTVTQVKTTDKEGYDAVQIGYETLKDRKVKKPQAGHFSKSGATPKRFLKEYRVSANSELNPGDEVTVALFSEGDNVTVSGVSIGKGFAGHMKRHGFSGGRRSHGKNSVMRKSGSVGASASPARIWPGTRMAGRMGGQNQTVRNLRIVRVDADNHYLFVKGAVPGAKNGIVYITKN